MVQTGTADDPLAWLADAACADLPPELFSPGPNEPLDPRVVAACDRCPVQFDCLVHAYTSGLRHMVRAGLRPCQLRALYVEQAWEERVRQNEAPPRDNDSDRA